MRFFCPGCEEAYLLEVDKPIPCPACGTMLQVGEVEEQAAGRELRESQRMQAVSAESLQDAPTQPAAAGGDAGPAPTAPQEGAPAEPVGRSETVILRRPPPPSPESESSAVTAEFNSDITVRLRSPSATSSGIRPPPISKRMPVRPPPRATTRTQRVSAISGRMQPARTSTRRTIAIRGRRARVLDALRPWYVRAGIAAGALLVVGAVGAITLRGRQTAVSAPARPSRPAPTPPHRPAGEPAVARLEEGAAGGAEEAAAGEPSPESAETAPGSGEKPGPGRLPEAGPSAPADEETTVAAEEPSPEVGAALSFRRRVRAASRGPRATALAAGPWRAPRAIPLFGRSAAVPEETEITRVRAAEGPGERPRVPEKESEAKAEAAEGVSRAAGTAEEHVEPSEAPEDRLVDRLRDRLEDSLRENKMRKELATDEAAEIGPLALQRSTVFELAEAERQLTVRASPDGMMEFVEANVPVQLTVVGAEGNEVHIDLQSGERVSAWPVAGAAVHALDDRFTVSATAADWAFVVRADKVRPKGLPARCDDLPCVLREGERVDTDRFGSRVVLRVAGPTWPGSLVRLLAGAKPRTVRLAKVVPEPVRPGVFADCSRDFPWQSVPLPLIDR